MNPLHSIRQARLLSTSNLLQRCRSFNWVSQASFSRAGVVGFLKSFSSVAQSFENVGNLERNLNQQGVEENVSDPRASVLGSFMHSSGPKYFETGTNIRSRNFIKGVIEEDGRGPNNIRPMRSSRPVDFVREVIGEDGKHNIKGSRFPRYKVEKNPDVVHIKLMRNNAFVTVTDLKGNKKCGASSGHLSELKGGVSRYAADATTEHVGRLARNMGIKSVVVRVNGFTHFRKKRQAIMNFKEGFCSSRSDENQIVYIEDTTRRAHNGCRLPKQRRI